MNIANEGVTAEVIKVIELEIRNIIHSGKSLCKHKDLSLILQTHIKSQA